MRMLNSEFVGVFKDNKTFNVVGDGHHGGEQGCLTRTSGAGDQDIFHTVENGVHDLCQVSFVLRWYEIRYGKSNLAK